MLMKKQIIKMHIRLIILILLSNIFYNCGRNITYIDKIEYTDKIQIKSVDCDKNLLDIKLDTISIFNTQKDTFLLRTHNNLSLYLDLKVVNNSDESIKFIIDRGNYEPSNFKWIIHSNEKIDTVDFYSYNQISEHIIKPKDSFLFSLGTPFYNFKKLLGEQKDYTKDMLALLSDFKLIYTVNNESVCVKQDSSTGIIVYNDKSKWSWW